MCAVLFSPGRYTCVVPMRLAEMCICKCRIHLHVHVLVNLVTSCRSLFSGSLALAGTATV